MNTNTLEHRVFPKCLIHAMTTPDGVRRQYILPYGGRLTEGHLESLAERLQDAVGHFYPGGTFLDYITRIKNNALTGREKNVTLHKDNHGTWNLKGSGWSRGGYPDGHFVVLEQSPSYSDC